MRPTSHNLSFHPRERSDEVTGPDWCAKRAEEEKKKSIDRNEVLRISPVDVGGMCDACQRYDIRLYNPHVTTRAKKVAVHSYLHAMTQSTF